MEFKYRNTVSRTLSEILRHKPQKIGITLDENGWVGVTELILAINKYNFVPVLLHEDDLRTIVKENNKQRFGFNEDGTKIRANQGHSVNIDLKLNSEIPPRILYHGTSENFIPEINKKGLLKMNRQHVHLSEDLNTATNVGNRKGGVIKILSINSSLMNFDGYKFYKSENNVWLTDEVPPQYIKF